MIELFFITCLMADPSRCEEHRLLFEQDTNAARHCMLDSQFTLSRWMADHPQERVREWECRSADRRERKA